MLHQIFVFSDGVMVGGEWIIPSPQTLAKISEDKGVVIKHIHTATLDADVAGLLDQASRLVGEETMLVGYVILALLVFSAFADGWQALDNLGNPNPSKQAKPETPLSTTIYLEWRKQGFPTTNIRGFYIHHVAQKALETAKQRKNMLLNLASLKELVMKTFSDGWKANQTEKIIRN